jgi:hypothetical protein
MIWNSIPFMTVIDLLIIAVTIYTIRRCRLIGPSKRPAAPQIGLRWIALGLLAVCLFYFADLLSMYVLPAVASRQEAMAFMGTLHRNLSWLVVAAKDIKDVAVLIGARRVLGNRMREPRSKSLEDGLLSSCVEREREYIMDFCPGRCAVLVGGYVKKRNDTPVDVLRLMRARLKEVENEYKKSGARAARKKG